ncbi:siderophore-interacting protein [Photobacterium profundum]|uniref:siderophore-interacting protein n=1 Tax=Photobacterium profundum TaxID=74109 RepID=UPI003D0C49BC
MYNPGDNSFHYDQQEQGYSCRNQVHLHPVRPFLVSVKHVTDITPALRRICFTSPLLANYPDVSGGAHIKIMMAHGEQAVPELPTLTDKGPRWLVPEDKPLIRTFSVRSFRRNACEIDIDFALHADSGPATCFAQQAQEGDVLAISGPGGPHPTLCYNQRGIITWLAI